MRTINWYNIANTLRDFIRNYSEDDGTQLFPYLEDRENFKVNIGKGITGDFPRIDILIGDETLLDEKEQAKITGANITLWLDIYVKGGNDGINDNGDYLYRQIFRCEDDLVKLFSKFDKLIQKTYGIATNFKVTGILSDGDLSAPVSIQHRVILEIEWRR